MDNGVGEYVKKWREKSGYSQSDLAKIMGITNKYVSNVETGRHRASAKFCWNLIQYMGDTDKGRLLDLFMEQYMERAAENLFNKKRRMRNAKSKRASKESY